VIPTPAQTVGPYFAIGLCRRPENELVSGDDALRLSGRLLDGEDLPVDGVIEVWDGRRWGRCGTDAEGRFSFRVDAKTPHFEVCVHARGLLRHRLTRIYLSGTDDPALAPLVAEPEDGGLRFDIRLQGERETVFFAH
jgi:protocatechuate 3,4-dioxygenase alpha subunit